MYIEIGKKYGKVTVLEEVGRTPHYEHLYKCVCECGHEFIRKDSVIKYALVRGCVPSCGCGRKKKKSPTNC